MQNRKILVGFFSVALIAALCYLQTLSFPFVYDDVFYVQQNPQIRTLSFSAFTSPFSPFAPGLYRPITTLSYALDFSVFGLNPMGFHLSNLLLHALASGVFFLLLFHLLRSYPAALFSAAIFAVHPVHTEAVVWVSGRSEVLAGLFVFTSALLFLRASRIEPVPSGALQRGSAQAPRSRGARREQIISGFAYFFALLSKEIAAPLPLILYFFDRKRPLRDFAPFVAALLIYLPLRITTLSGLTVPLEHVRTAGLSLLERMTLMIPVFAHYLRLMELPLGLRIEYDWSSFSSSTTFFSALLILLVIAAALWLWKKGWRIAALGVAWFFLFLLPVSNIIPIGELVAERFLYLPSAGYSLLIGALIVRFFPDSQKKACLLLSIVLIFFAGLTVQRNAEWKDPELLWRSTLAHSPNAPHAMQNLASILLAKGELVEAEEIINQALTIWPKKAMLHFIAAQIAAAKGEGETQKAELEEALRLSEVRDLEITDFQRGAMLLQLGRFADAFIFLEEANAQFPDEPTILNNLGIAQAKLGKLDEALQSFERAIELFEERQPLSAEDQRNYEGAVENRGMLRPHP